MKPDYIFSGIVIAGKKRGAELGFPTANVMLAQDIPEGIYASLITIKNNSYQAATFIGSAKTFNETEVKAESYILDFSESIYGEKVTVKLFKKIRSNHAFSSVDELIEQMHKDVKEIRSFFILKQSVNL
jgi:riboflavin kinase/FMN adenylyltransferase